MSPSLAPFVESCTAYDQVFAGPEAHRGLPSTSVTVVLTVAEPLQVAWWDARQAARSYVAATCWRDRLRLVEPVLLGALGQAFRGSALPRSLPRCPG